jgi:hypothetical protein
MMRLGLSFEADPQASPDELADACRRRGLSALELPLGCALPAEAIASGTASRFSAVHAAGFLADASHPLDADACRDAGVPIVLSGATSHGQRLEAASRLRRDGAAALALMAGDAANWLDDALAGGGPVAWQVDESCADPAADLRRILAHPGLLAYIRLVGGGPESVSQDGRGIGRMMAQLALAGYAGPVILTPSSRRYRVIWSTWLGRRGGWGCGSKVAS